MIDRYIPDFACIDVRLIVEVDGGYHDNESQQEYDTSREANLRRVGFEIMRFTNEQVLEETHFVVEEIRKALHRCATGINQRNR